MKIAGQVRSFVQNYKNAFSKQTIKVQTLFSKYCRWQSCINIPFLNSFSVTAHTATSYLFVALRPNAIHGLLIHRFLYHTQRRTTVCRNPLDGWSVRSRGHYLTINNTHNRQTFMPPAGFEPTISAGERPQTYTLDRATTGTGCCYVIARPLSCWNQWQ